MTQEDRSNISTLFNAFAEVKDVRMSPLPVSYNAKSTLTHTTPAPRGCFVDVATVEQAVAVMNEHERLPFLYYNRPLQINYARLPEISESRGRILQLTGFAGGEQRLRHMFKHWDERLESIKVGEWAKTRRNYVTNSFTVSSTRSEDGIAYLAFKDSDDALAAMEMCYELYPHIDAFLRRDPAEIVEPVDHDIPSDTLCLVGYDGNKAGLRQFLHNYRHLVRDVRRSKLPSLVRVFWSSLIVYVEAGHEETDRWDFVFVQFVSIDVATDALHHLKQFDGVFRVRYAIVRKRRFSV